MLVVLLVFNCGNFVKLFAQSAEKQSPHSFFHQAIDFNSKRELKGQLEDFIKHSISQNAIQDIPPDYCAKNCLLLICNERAGLLINSDPTELKEIRDLVFRFLENPDKEVWHSDSVATNYAKTSGYLSKGIINFTFDSLISTKVIDALAEVLKGISDYRNVLAKRYYQQDFRALNSQAQAELNAKLQYSIGVSNFLPPPPPPPPPPPFPESAILQDLEEEEEDFNLLDPPRF